MRKSRAGSKIGGTKYSPPTTTQYPEKHLSRAAGYLTAMHTAEPGVPAKPFSVPNKDEA